MDWGIGDYVMRPLLIFVLGIWVISSVPASAETVLGVCSLNGVTVSSDVTVGYDGVGSSAAADFASDSDSKLVVPPTPSGTAIATAVVVPTAGAAKDRVDGTLKASFEFGIPVGGAGQDTLLLDASGTGSALNSTNSVGNVADATVTGEARAEFFIDIVAGTDCDTFLNMQEVRLLEPHEILLEINVIFDPGLPTQLNLATLSPGSPAQTVLLPEDHSYLIQLNYDYRVPFGVDPPFSFSYAITVGASPAVPVLGTGGAIALGLMLLGTAVLAARRTWTRSHQTP